jgi:hypothetical protein
MIGDDCEGGRGVTVEFSEGDGYGVYVGEFLVSAQLEGE